MPNPYQQELDWRDLYNGLTSRDDQLFTPASTAHPAKMALPLLRRIFGTLLEWGWLAPGSVVVDPFGGRGTTAAVWCGMAPRNRAVTLEIEPHFVAMQEANREHARRKLGRPLRWVILKGDSRNADGHLMRRPGWFASCVTSPPYVTALRKVGGQLASVEQSIRKPGPNSMENLGGYGDSPGQIGALPDAAAITSPPYGQGVIAASKQDPAEMIARTPSLRGRNPEGAWFKALAAGYQPGPGNIDLLPDALGAVTSPPYGDTEILQPGASIGAAWKDGKHARDTFVTDPTARRYGKTEGQIGALPDPAAVTSPPYVSGGHHHGIFNAWGGQLEGDRGDAALAKKEGGYGHTEGQIGDLPDGAAAVTSPPYEGSLASGDPDEKGGLFRDPRRRNDRTLTNGYSAPAAVTSAPYEAQSGGHGEASRKGMIGEQGVVGRHAASNTNLGYAVATTSPPYENSVNQSDAANDAEARIERMRAAGIDVSRPVNVGGPNGVTRQPQTCGQTDGQIGATQGETYESACAQVYAALARAGVRYLVTVTKNPTRAGKLRRLDKTTARLLRAAGYRVVGWRRAWLFESVAHAEARAGQGGLFDDVEPSRKVVGRLSFFKRLHLAKGGLAAQWEDVYFAELIP